MASFTEEHWFSVWYFDACVRSLSQVSKSISVGSLIERTFKQCLPYLA